MSKIKKKKKTSFVANILKIFRPLPLTPFDLRPKFCIKWKALQSYITLGDRSFGSNFREVSLAIICNLFCVIFHGIQSIQKLLYKSLSSDAITLSQKNEFLALRAFQFTLSWRYITMVSSISRAFVVVNFFDPSLFQYCRNSHQRYYSSNEKHCLKNAEGFLSIYGKGAGPTLTPLSLLNMGKIEKNKQ